MNHFEGTAILRHDAVISSYRGKKIAMFTACNTEVEELWNGKAKMPLWLDCVWPEFDNYTLSLLKERALVKLGGRIYPRPYPREDGSEGMALGVQVMTVVFYKLMEGTGPR